MMIEEFLNYLQYEQNRSELTVKGYGDDLKAFESYFKNLDGHDLSWESVDSDVIRGWMESMMDKGNTATSINRRLSALRSLYRFALSRKLVSKNPTRTVVGPKKGKPLPQYLRESEMDRLLDDSMWKDDYNDVRARTIIIMFYETGMRLSELVGLDDEAVDFLNHDKGQSGTSGSEKTALAGVNTEETLATRAKTYLRNRHAEP